MSIQNHFTLKMVLFGHFLSTNDTTTQKHILEKNLKKKKYLEVTNYAFVILHIMSL